MKQTPEHKTSGTNANASQHNQSQVAFGAAQLFNNPSSENNLIAETTQLNANDSINGITVSENHAVKELSGGKVDLHESGAKVENTTSSDSRLQSVGARSMAVQGQAMVGDSRDRGHEIWHLAQQEMGEVKPTTEINGTPVNDEKHLEDAADKNGAAIMQAKFAGPPDEQMK